MFFLEDDNHQMTSSKKCRWRSTIFFFLKFKASEYVKIIVAAAESLSQMLKGTILKLNVCTYKQIF